MNAPRDLWFGTSGPRDAKVAIVGESWGFEEAAEMKPFVGQSGQELRRMLTESRSGLGLEGALLMPDSCFMTNVCAARPPDNDLIQFCLPTKEARSAGRPAFKSLYPNDFMAAEIKRLYEQLSAVKPTIIVATGNWSAWALSTMYSVKNEDGRKAPAGITSWRGSMGYTDEALPLPKTKLVPIIHPAAILREWYWRVPTVHDIRQRVGAALRNDWRRTPEPVVLAPPTFEQAEAFLNTWLYRAKSEKFRLVNDIETARHAFITCIGFSDSERFAMTIPFVRLDVDGSMVHYWKHSEELQLSSLIRKVLSHPNILVEGQNYLYDTQYIQKSFGCSPNLDFDTMLAHHLLFPGTPKGLDYLSSLYCKYHWYWKDDNKDWDLKGRFDEHLRYNAEDCLRQFECGTVLRAQIKNNDLDELWQERMEVNRLALRMMNRGVAQDHDRRKQLALELALCADDFAKFFERIIPQSIVVPGAKTPWFDSPKQQRDFFGEVLGLAIPRHRKTGQPSFGKEALGVLTQKHPEYTKLFTALKDYRSVGVFFNTFVKAPLDPDGRMRCMFNVAGTETFRWSSSENAFGAGTNLQNLPKGTED